MPRRGDRSDVKQLAVKVLHTGQHDERDGVAVFLNELHNICSSPLLLASPAVNVQYGLVWVKPVLLYLLRAAQTQGYQITYCEILNTSENSSQNIIIIIVKLLFGDSTTDCTAYSSDGKQRRSTTILLRWPVCVFV